MYPQTNLLLPPSTDRISVEIAFFGSALGLDVAGHGWNGAFWCKVVMASFFLVLFFIRVLGSRKKDEVHRANVAAAEARGEVYRAKVSWGDHMVERCASNLQLRFMSSMLPSISLNSATGLDQLLVLIMLGEIVAASAILVKESSAHTGGNYSVVTTVSNAHGAISSDSLLATAAVSFIAAACYLLYFNAVPRDHLSGFNLSNARGVDEAHVHVLMFIALSALGPACKRALEGIMSGHEGSPEKCAFTIALLCTSSGGYLMVSSFLLISGEDTNAPRLSAGQRFATRFLAGLVCALMPLTHFTGEADMYSTKLAMHLSVICGLFAAVLLVEFMGRQPREGSGIRCDDEHIILSDDHRRESLLPAAGSGVL